MPDEPKDDLTIPEDGAKPEGEAKPEAKPDGAKPEGEAKPDAKAPAKADDLLLDDKEPEVDLDSLDYAGLLKHAEIDAAELAAEVVKNGKPTPEQYAKLKKIGVPKSVADRLIKLEMDNDVRNAQSVESIAADVNTEHGGADKVKLMRQWAAKNIDAKTRERWNGMIKANPAAYKDVVRSIAAEYAAKNGGRSGGGSATSVSGGGGGPGKIANGDELSKVMSGVERGDRSAIEKLKATPLHELGSFV